MADPEILPREVRKALPGRCSHPETVDFDEPPAKLYCAREKCPALKALLDDMLDLANCHR